MPKVTFDCGCAQSVVSVTIQRSSDPSDVEGLLFKTTGSQTIDLSKGDHDLSYRAVGTPFSRISLTVSKGGKLDRDVDRDLGEKGRGAGQRVVTVGAWLLAILLGAPGAARAQAAPPSSLSAEQEKKVITAVKNDLVVLPAAGTPRVPSVAFSLDAASTEKKGAVSVVLGSKTFTGGLTISGPLDNTTNSAEPLTTTGLSGGAAVELGLHWFIWKGKPNMALGHAICQRNTGNKNCDDNEIKDDSERTLYLQSQAANANPYVIDVIASSGKNTFKFLDNDTYAAKKEGHTDIAFGVAVGRYTPKTGLISVGYTYGQEWEAAGPARNICTPIAGTSSTECRTSPVGAPSEGRKHEIGIEQRLGLVKGRVAIAPRVAFDAKDKVTTVALPIYFFATKDGALSGGVKGTWTSKDPHVIVSVFIGPAFRIFN